MSLSFSFLSLPFLLDYHPLISFILWHKGLWCVMEWVWLGKKLWYVELPSLLYNRVKSWGTQPLANYEWVIILPPRQSCVRFLETFELKFLKFCFLVSTRGSGCSLQSASIQELTKMFSCILLEGKADVFGGKWAFQSVSLHCFRKNWIFTESWGKYGTRGRKLFLNQIGQCTKEYNFSTSRLQSYEPCDCWISCAQRRSVIWESLLRILWNSPFLLFPGVLWNKYRASTQRKQDWVLLHFAREWLLFFLGRGKERMDSMAPFTKEMEEVQRVLSEWLVQYHGPSYQQAGIRKPVIVWIVAASRNF